MVPRGWQRTNCPGVGKDTGGGEGTLHAMTFISALLSIWLVIHRDSTSTHGTTSGTVSTGKIRRFLRIFFRSFLNVKLHHLPFAYGVHWVRHFQATVFQCS